MSSLQPAFIIRRKGKNREARELKLADISRLFGLRLPNAAKELGMSTTSLKKACRFFGLDRWPGRKVRGLESTIDGLKQALVRQGGDSEDGRMRAEIPKLQQEMDELCHGTLEQIREKMHSPTLIATNAYQRLYSVHGWRSKHHNLGRHDINAGNQPHLTSGLATPPVGGNSSASNRAVEVKKHPVKQEQRPALCTNDPLANQRSETTPNAHKESPRQNPRKFIRPSPRRILRSSSRLGSRDTEMKACDLEGLWAEVHEILPAVGREVPESVVQVESGHNILTPKKQIGEEGAWNVKVEVEDEGATFGEPSDKRPKMEPLFCSKCGKRIL